jgi:hypothetical protein
MNGEYHEFRIYRIKFSLIVFFPDCQTVGLTD